MVDDASVASEQVEIESRYGRIARIEDSIRLTVYGGARSRTSIYPDTEPGSDDAWEDYRQAVRRGRLARCLNGLIVVAVVSAIVWIATIILGTLGAAFAVARSTDEQWPILNLTLQIDRLAYAMFLGTTSTYGLIWLYRRGIPNNGR
jgi:hypothetical protein